MSSRDAPRIERPGALPSVGEQPGAGGAHWQLRQRVVRLDAVGPAGESRGGRIRIEAPARQQAVFAVLAPVVEDVLEEVAALPWSADRDCVVPVDEHGAAP